MQPTGNVPQRYANRTEAATTYKTRGYSPIPLEPGSKNPGTNGKGWQTRSYRLEDFAGDGNIGLLTGEASGGLVDIDLDCPEAIAAALYFLPPTQMVHGRRSKPASHYWYKVTRNLPASRTAFFDPAQGDRGMLVELRSSDGRTAIQTVVPPSTHVSGEAVEWVRFGEPAEIDGEELQRAVRLVAVVSLIARHWPQEGKRHDASLALAGYLLKNGIDEDLVGEIVSTAADIAGDEEADARRKNVDTSARKLEAGDRIVGAGVVAEIFPSNVLSRVNEWLGIQRTRMTAPSRVVPKTDGDALTDELEFSDAGNALRLARTYGSVLRYVRQWGWLVYREGRWQRDEIGHAMQCAKACISDLLHEAVQPETDNARRGQLLDHVKRSFNANRLQAMLKLAESEPGIAARVEDFNKNPWLLNVQNGTIDLRTGTLKKHDPNDMITRIAPVTFDPQAKAPRWEKFLSEVFTEDSDVVAFVQRALGYSLTGVTREQVFFTCWGAGCNGKSTLLNAVAAVLGDYAKPLKADALMAHPFKNSGGADPEIAALVGARLVTAQEPRGGELDTAKVKELTGQDSIQVRELHKMPFTFVPQFKLWLSTNERPKVTETTNGTWRRLRLIPFTESFEGRKDETLPESLAGEASGILNWLIAGCLAWQQEGLGDAEAVREATREYREEEDPYIAYFTEVLQRADVGQRVELKDAYDAYKTWAYSTDAPPLSDREFPKQAEAHGYHKKRAHGKRYLVGCTLVPTAGADGADNLSSLLNTSHEGTIESFRTDGQASAPATPDEDLARVRELVDSHF